MQLLGAVAQRRAEDAVRVRGEGEAGFQGHSSVPQLRAPVPLHPPCPRRRPQRRTPRRSLPIARRRQHRQADAPPPVAHSIVPGPPGPAPPEQLYLTPPSSPGSPDTPESSRWNSTSPASSVSPPTPTRLEDYNAKIATPGGSVPMSVARHIRSLQLKGPSIQSNDDTSLAAQEQPPSIPASALTTLLVILPCSPRRAPNSMC